MKLLLPLDVLHPYDEVLSDLARLVPFASSDIVLLYVIEESNWYEQVLQSLGKSVEEMHQQASSKAKAVLEEVAKKLKDKCKSVRVLIKSGLPAKVIEEVAVEEKSDVIVIGSTQQPSAQDYLLGSTASNVVKHAPGTVLLLRKSAINKKDFKRVLITVDGSEQSLRALRTFVSQFQPNKRQVEIYLLTVVSIVGIWKYISPVEFVAAIEDNLNMSAQMILAEAEKCLAEDGMKPTDMIVRSGDISTEIIKTAQDIEADLIVVGAQGKTAVEHFLLGSVSNKLSLHAACATAVVK